MLTRMLRLSLLKHSLSIPFHKIDGQWYVDFPEYPGPQANLAMVLGADDLLDEISPDQDRVEVKICLKVKTDMEEYKLRKTDIFDEDLPIGRWYDVNYSVNNTEPKLIWLCPVMLYTFGHYPNRIYISK